MEYKVLSSDGETEYTVDTEKVTCTCPQFTYRCAHKPIDSEERLCKHIAKVFEEHPELIPARLQHEYSQADMSGKDPDGKTRYPRTLFDLYVTALKSTINQFSNIIERFEICGSYRRLASRVSDLDVLLELKPNTKWDSFLDYLENILRYKLIQEIGRGDAKAAYMVDGFVHIDFMSITHESWPFALLHFTGSKGTNIDMRRRANQLGYTLNQYGLTDENGITVEGLNTEKDIFEFLQLPYKQPWDR